MKTVYKKIVFAGLFIPVIGYGTPPCPSSFGQATTPYFSIRSQGVNAVRDLVGWQQLIHRCCNDTFYMATALTLEYDHTFRSSAIAQSLFGDDINCDDCYPTLTISGSQAANRGPKDWLADYFGLPTDFKSIITFNPTIQNFIADIGFYIGFDSCLKGLYFRCNLPLVHTKWNLDFCECVIEPGVNLITPGYFTPSPCEESRAHLLPNATDFFCGQTPNLVFGTWDPLQESLWCSATHINKTLAAVNMVLGWNFICCDDYHLGFNFRVSAPTGDKPQGTYLFEPIVGNGHHWEVGGGISAHSLFWRGCNDATWTLYAEANITHLFTTTQTRSFDLCGKPNSRYMLAENMGPNIEDLAGCPTPALANCPNATFSNNQFADEFTPVANLTRSSVDVSIPVQGDIVFKFAYAHPCGFAFDLGYNLWARSREKIRRSSCCAGNPLADGKSWALKGDATVFGFEFNNTQVVHELAATESCATIHSGTNGFVPGNISTLGNVEALTNPGIDNPQFAIVTNVPDFLITVSPIPLTADPVRTSIQPVYLTSADVDMHGTPAISHKIFAHLNYTWEQCKNWEPFLGIGASVELGQKGCNTGCLEVSNTDLIPTSCQNNVRNNAISQWSLWIKGGFSFDYLPKSQCCYTDEIKSCKRTKKKVRDLERRIQDLEQKLSQLTEPSS